MKRVAAILVFVFAVLGFMPQFAEASVWYSCKEPRKASDGKYYLGNQYANGEGTRLWEASPGRGMFSSAHITNALISEDGKYMVVCITAVAYKPEKVGCKAEKITSIINLQSKEYKVLSYFAQDISTGDWKRQKPSSKWKSYVAFPDHPLAVAITYVQNFWEKTQQEFPKKAYEFEDSL